MEEREEREEREEQFSSMNSVISPPRWNSKTIFFLLIATAIVYIPSLFNHFTNWDDEIYILNNPLIKNFSANGIAAIFSTPEYMGNYHPLTLLSYAFDYYLAGLQPFAYHATNILLHLGCTLFVFIFLIELGMKQASSFLAAVLFGLHPMHVESVAWLSARKDVLYAVFFLGALICYVRYIHRNNNRWYFLSLLLFICSLLSKAVAVVLPVIILLIDYLHDRQFSKKSIFEKIPFFLLSILFGIVAIVAQQSAKAIDQHPAFDFIDRLFIGAYGLVNYIIKLAFPFNLSALYFYPSEITGLPSTFYFSFALVMLAAVAVIVSIRKTKKIFFGTAFFGATILLVLQIIPVGRAMMADRYSYISSIGFFYLLAVLFENRESQWKSFSQYTRKGMIVMLCVYCVWLGVTTWQRCGVWDNGITIWTDVIEKNPSDPGLYNSRGQAYMSAGDLQNAMRDFNMAIALKPDYKHALTDRGNIYYATKQYTSAISDFTSAIALDRTFALGYYDRANSYAQIKKFDLALQDYSTALQLKPDYGDAFYNRGVLKLALGDSSGACNDFRNAAQFIPEIAQKVLVSLCR